jgi:hypothetical protein
MGNGIRGVVVLGVLLLGLCPRANAVELPADWNLARNYSNVKRMGGADSVMMYLMGAGNAYIMANGNAMARNQPLLYCQPPGLTLNALNFLDIFEKELARGPPEAVLNYGDEMVLLFGLQRTFPCPSK